MTHLQGGRSGRVVYGTAFERKKDPRFAPWPGQPLKKLFIYYLSKSDQQGYSPRHLQDDEHVEEDIGADVCMVYGFFCLLWPHSQ